MNNRLKYIITGFMLVLICCGIALLSNRDNAKQEITHSVSNSKIEQNRSIDLSQNIQDKSTQNDHSESDDSFKMPVQMNDQAFKSQYGNLPSSLRRTEIPGNLMVDMSGKLIVTEDLRDVFEYFLSGMGEEPYETLIARIEEYLKYALPDSASQEAIEILHSYLTYKKKLEELESDKSIIEGREDRIAALKDILSQRMLVRRQCLSPDVVDAFFGESEKYDLFTLGRIEIEQNAVLSEQEKESRLIELEEQLPEHMKERRQEYRTRQKLQKTIDEIRQKGGSEEEVFQARAEIFGPEAAERLAELDKQTANWENRLHQFTEGMKSITQQKELSDDEKQERINELKYDLFDDTEISRVDAIIQSAMNAIQKSMNQPTNQ